MFFDPDADEPVPLSPGHFDEELGELTRDAGSGKLDAGPAFIRAWQELGYVVTGQNMHLFSAEEIAAWGEAVERQGDDLTPVGTGRQAPWQWPLRSGWVPGQNWRRASHGPFRRSPCGPHGGEARL